MKKQLTFRQWLMRQVKRDDLVGDFARDVRRDPGRPDFKTYQEWHNYLYQKNFLMVVAIFRLAWREYNQ